MSVEVRIKETDEGKYKLVIETNKSYKTIRGARKAFSQVVNNLCGGNYQYREYINDGT